MRFRDRRWRDQVGSDRIQTRASLKIQMISNLKSKASNIRSQISDLKSDLRSQISNYQISNLRSQIPDLRSQIPDLKSQTLPFLLSDLNVSMNLKYETI